MNMNFEPEGSRVNRPEALPIERALTALIVAPDSECTPAWKKDRRFCGFAAQAQNQALKAYIRENIPLIRSWRAELAECRQRQSGGFASEELPQQLLELEHRIAVWSAYTVELMKLRRQVAGWLDRSGQRRVLAPDRLIFIDKEDPTKPPVVFSRVEARTSRKDV